jgi:hypothetical protein
MADDSKPMSDERLEEIRRDYGWAVREGGRQVRERHPRGGYSHLKVI